MATVPSSMLSPLPPSLTNSSDESSSSSGSSSHSLSSTQSTAAHRNHSLIDIHPASSASSLYHSPMKREFPSPASVALPPPPPSLPPPFSTNPSPSAAIYDRTHGVALTMKSSNASYQLMNTLRSNSLNRFNDSMNNPNKHPSPPAASSSSSSSQPSPLPVSLHDLAAMQSQEMNDSDGGLSIGPFHGLETLHSAVAAATPPNTTPKPTPFSSFPSFPSSSSSTTTIPPTSSVSVPKNESKSAGDKSEKKSVQFTTEKNDTAEGGGTTTDHSAGEHREMDDEQVLPSANISRIMKLALPEGVKMSKEARSAVQDCVNEFIGFITSESAELLNEEQRKTITGDDLIDGLKAMGFHHYIKFLTLYLHRFRQSPKSLRKSIKRNKKLHMTGDIAPPVLQQAVLSRLKERSKKDKRSKKRSTSVVKNKSISSKKTKIEENTNNQNDDDDDNESSDEANDDD